MVLAGVYLLVPEISIDNSQTLAIGFGICSALCYAVRNLILKTKVAIYQGFFYDLGAIVGQWEGLLGVALITTAMGHTMFINTFRSFSVTTISILSSVQPVYGIIIGALFMAEIPSWSTLLGGILILFSVVIESIRSYR